MAEETYNGWKNVETWRVQLHLTNDEQEAGKVWAEVVSRWADVVPLPGHSVESLQLQDYLRDYVTRSTGCDVPGESTWEMFSRDVVQAALDRVAWDELAVYWSTVGLQETEPRG